MAVRNDKLNGNDWNIDENVTSEDFNDTFDAVIDINAPIGTILPWHKDFANTPSLSDDWVECNGQTINDADSPYDGQTVPDLNGDNRFFRANSTSGGTGGSETQTYSIQGQVNNVDSGAGHVFDSLSGQLGSTGSGDQTYNTSTEDNQPQFVNMVMIMRIK